MDLKLTFRKKIKTGYIKVFPKKANKLQDPVLHILQRPVVQSIDIETGSNSSNDDLATNFDWQLLTFTPKADSVIDESGNFDISIYTSAALILIIVSSIIVVVTFFGCCGAIKVQQYLIIVAWRRKLRCSTVSRCWLRNLWKIICCKVLCLNHEKSFHKVRIINSN